MRKLFLGCVLLIALVGGSYKALLNWSEQPYALGQGQVLIIEPGTSTYQIAQSLKPHKAITFAPLFLFYVFAAHLDGKLQAGEYQLYPSESLASIAHRIARGDVMRHKFLIPEGWTVRQIRAALLADEKLTGPLPDQIPEGSLFPSTYVYTRGTQRQTLISQMQQQHQQVMSALLRKYPQLPTPLTPDQLVILASIVERETGLPQERARVASVFLNRLREGLRLQSDPTVIYGLEIATGCALARALTKDDLQSATPFNTYVNMGLPPTPICNPGFAALEAVLNPLNTKDLYFVANETGGHTFSQTYAEHKKHHETWRKIRESRAAEMQQGTSKN